jgi:acetyl-CoA carboxylase/biotin carboxylase 1
MTQREKQLLPVYNQVALQFADLHDRAGRMKAKGVIRDSIQWSESRRFFYWRLRRRLNEEYLLRRMSNSVYSMTACSNAIPPNVAANRVAELRHANLRRLAAWTGIANFEHADKDVAVWYEDNRKAVADKIEAMRSQNFAAEICNVLSSNKRDGMVGVREMLRSMPLEEREQLIKFLQE